MPPSNASIDHPPPTIHGNSGCAPDFGSAFHRLGEAKKKFDPDHVLTPGYDVFEGSLGDGVSRRRAEPG
ncbi:hypothetical protein W59_00859 [Rhodococcus opacus RKJ300 = JCM 13270]|uniref:Berberine/berberine-like domain-containing protein n=1 Tax=Rhodococcus opacus RKJ300 = JCM 13270 TaxID=1165867 RepID=I0WZL7_RHOOP|nr:hypothetical protein W59_00859 [Rhodococcus opacus RKJ300 = JCM 13270]